MRNLLWMRHVQPRKHVDIYAVSNQFELPFSSNGSSTYGGDNESPFEIPTQNALVFHSQSVWIARFPKQKWLSVSTLDADIDDILLENASRTRLEFAKVKSEGKQIVSIEIVSAGSLLCGLTLKNDTFRVRGTGDFPKTLKACRDAKSAISAMRKAYGLGRTLKCAVEVDSQIEVMSETGRRLAPKTCGLMRLGGPKRELNNENACRQLKKAIDTGNAKSLRAAIDAGASLDRMLDNGNPLGLALSRFSEKGGAECLQVLLEAGAWVEDGFRAIFHQNLYSETQCVEITRFLLDNGIDIDGENCHQPPLLTAVVEKNVPAMELLVSLGANIKIRVPWKKVYLTSWVRKEYERATKRTDKAQFAEMLSALTKKKVTPPKTPKISKALQHENDRFQAGIQALAILDNLPASFEMKSSRKNYLKAEPEAKRLANELHELGFEKTGQFIEGVGFGNFIITFTNPKERLDAAIFHPIFEDWLGCRVFGTGDNDKLFETRNYELKLALDLRIPFLVEKAFQDARPEKLVNEIRKLVRARKTKLKTTPAKSFVKRYTAGSKRMLAAIPDAVQTSLVKGQINVGRKPAKFERRRIYPDFSGWDDPTYSTARIAADLKESLQGKKTHRNSTGAERATKSAFVLLVMQHLQFAGAPKDNAFLKQGVKTSVELFGKLKTNWKSQLKLQHADTLAMALLLCQANQDTASFSGICDQISGSIATRDHFTGGISTEVAEATLVMVSHFRERKIPKLDSFREHALKDRRDRAKCLIHAIDAFADSNAKQLAKHLSASIEHFVEHSDPRELRDYSRACFAHPESVLRNEAARKGMKVKLPRELEDYLLVV